jgi:hypothetical protein
MVGVRVLTCDRAPMACPAITRTVTPPSADVVEAMSLLWISWYPGSILHDVPRARVS